MSESPISLREALHWWIAGVRKFGEFHVSQKYTGALRNPAAVSNPRVETMIGALRTTNDLEEYQRRFRTSKILRKFLFTHLFPDAIIL